MKKLSYKKIQKRLILYSSFKGKTCLNMSFVYNLSVYDESLIYNVCISILHFMSVCVLVFLSIINCLTFLGCSQRAVWPLCRHLLSIVGAFKQAETGYGTDTLSASCSQLAADSQPCVETTAEHYCRTAAKG